MSLEGRQGNLLSVGEEGNGGRSYLKPQGGASALDFGPAELWEQSVLIQFVRAEPGNHHRHLPLWPDPTPAAPSHQQACRVPWRDAVPQAHFRIQKFAEAPLPAPDSLCGPLTVSPWGPDGGRGAGAALS